MPETKYIVLVPWGEQSCPSIKLRCSKCGCAVAMDARNQDKFTELSLTPICMECSGITTIEDARASKGIGLVGGKQYNSFDEGLAAALADERRKHN